MCRGEVLIEIEGKNISEYFDITTASPESRAPIEVIAFDEALAIVFLTYSDRRHYASLLDNLENQSPLDTDQYPPDIPSALTNFECYVGTTLDQQSHRHIPPQEETDGVDMAFM